MAKMDVGFGPVNTNITDSVDFGFSAKNGKKLIGMLANFLYSDKEYAVLSELGANAYDAHKMVKKTDPISITLPTKIEPAVIVRDYGPGMSEEDIYTFLTQFGESSKQDDNNQIGFWGIGSKSPAAVTDTWSIRSYHNGKMMHFEVFINEDGVPTLKKMMDVPSSETGLHVEIPVESSKAENWVRAAKKAFKYYEQKPVFNLPVNFETVSYDSKNELWGTRKVQYGESGSIRIITTMREYSVPKDNIPSSLAPEVLLYFKNMRYPLDLFFNVGEIDLSISREQVQYNKKTNEAIAGRLTYIFNSFKKEFEDEIVKMSDALTYRACLNTWYNKLTHRNIVVQYISAQNGKFGVRSLPNDINLYSVPIKEEVILYYAGKPKKIDYNKNRLDARSVIITKEDYYKSEKFLSVSVSDIKNVAVVIRDIKNVYERVKTLPSHVKYIIVETDPFNGLLPVFIASDITKVKREKTIKDYSDVWGVYGSVSHPKLERITKSSYDSLNPETTVSVKIANAKSAFSAGNDILFTDEISMLMKYGYKIVCHKTDNMVFQSPKEALKKIKTKVESRPEFDTLCELTMLWEFYSANHNYVVSMGIINSNLIEKISGTKLGETIKPLKLISNLMKKFNISNLRYVHRPSEDMKYYFQVCKLIDEKPKHIEVLDVADIEKFVLNYYPMLKYFYKLNEINFGDLIEVVGYINLVEGV